MHLSTSAIIFVTITCGLPAVLSTWRDPTQWTFECKTDHTAVCIKDKSGGGYWAILATSQQPPSRRPDPSKYNCIRSQATQQGCCLPGAPHLFDPGPYTPLTAVDYDRFMWCSDAPELFRLEFK
ncbi:hypothetical protein Pst134EA_031252 [Puccinia striiformis f. sp. tritici]|uniref:uncharacterized protein n=1 Tax=Puccinia striiformis f. sp. tritici TaxID=168172 RepID=UPI0020085A11|nr:uncharacterized protein Pst134EA_031252 [Puccinia striiformis f. sp. tritici]KAH9443416.1 hypothetical protein Pst134EA_031252 [Puccinia striiformis f. sp. tritici]